jgi:hypothetical protein
MEDAWITNDDGNVSIKYIKLYIILERTYDREEEEPEHSKHVDQHLLDQDPSNISLVLQEHH